MASKKAKNVKSAKPPRKAIKGGENQRNIRPDKEKSGFTVVGIGASAGGLPALQSFFDALPSDTGMAYVVVTHLHPEHESHLADLLQPHTKMTVRQVSARVGIEPDHVYVIPPNRNIMIADAHLTVTEFEEPHGQRTPIDAFFRSLAKGHHNAVGIIMSGGGTDGAVGIKDIKEEGGLLLVQDPNEAEYDSMPNAAINTGVADVILPVKLLAAKLVDYGRVSPALPENPNELSPQEVDTLQRILAQVHARTGHDFTQYKRSTVLRRIQRRMQLNGQRTLDGYLGYLRTNATESSAMFSDILIGVTNFFRDQAAWDALGTNVIPQIFANKEPGETIRIWSIGCATGEEAYTMAMVVLEHMLSLNEHFEFQVFASDLDETALMRAREGIYPAAIEADVSPERLERFFHRQGNHYQVRRELRDNVLFTNHSIVRDPPFSRLDLIVCRNVLIYLQRPVQDNLFDIFHYALNPGGFLFLGSSESAESAQELFQIVDKTHRIYRANPWRGEHPHVPSLPLTVRKSLRTDAHPKQRVLPTLSTHETTSFEERHAEALERYGPPTLLVDNHNTILHVSESAGRFLLPGKGPITNDVLKLIRPELQVELRTALFQAFEKDKAIVSPPIPVQFNGDAHFVVLSVRPQRINGAPDLQGGRAALVVLLEDEFGGASRSATEEIAGTRGQNRSAAMVAQLEAEVQRLREQLQATVEEYDSSNEEMKAANEELQSINEEYRSATEELETSKEELQSVNEELQTVNSELKAKLEEISRAHSDLENLMGATEIATLFLDRELRIQRFTPGTEHLLNIMPADRGRPIGHLTHNLEYATLAEDAQQVLRKLVPIVHEVAGRNGEWYLLRLRPYRTVEDRIDGVVVTFIDITKLKEAESALRELNETLEARVVKRTEELDIANQQLSQGRDLFYTLFHANPIPTALTQVSNNVFLDVNVAFVSFFGIAREQVLGRTPEQIGLDLPTRRGEGDEMMQHLNADGSVQKYEIELTLPSGDQKSVLASMQDVLIDKSLSMISTYIDITDMVRAETQIRSLASHVTEAEQSERHRISQILHDDLQQRLFAVKMHLTTLQQSLATKPPEELRQDIAQIDHWLEEAVQLTRELRIDLSPLILEGEGLFESLTWLASQMRELYKLEVQVDSSGEIPQLDGALRMLLFQAVRELLFNVVKHANTSSAGVRLERSDSRLQVTVSDLGRGFDPRKIFGDHGHAHGLGSIRSRLAIMSASMEVESADGEGTRVVITAPVVQAKRKK